ncbi:probable pectinesterase/pectinesterase inhibitor 51 [Tanacetum coccineum]|uniref:Probable pectinesterase/pectinesterase inhibitor 51 n=1 Tax=Tanacetum coccineum TaxID=301880 RepID=A0ABQ5BC20_9ASTR
MAITLLFISFLVLISSTSNFAVDHHPPGKHAASSPSDQIRQACKATRNQTLCESSFSKSSNLTTPTKIIQTALSMSLNNIHTAQAKVQEILITSKNNPNRTTAAKNCMEHLRNSEYRIKSTLEVLPHGKIKDARAWTSAGFAYQYDCWSGLNNVNDTKIVVDTMSFIMTFLISYTSNALSMIRAYDVFGDNTAMWGPPKTERDGFWENAMGGRGGKGLGLPVGLKVDVTVCKGAGGGCKYGTVQEAVNAAPDWGGGRRFVILVKAGVYKETVRVGLEKQNVVILGEGMGRTVITGDLSVGQSGISTYNTATVGVLGDGFMASNLTFENTADLNAHQAVAFRTTSDQSIMEDCNVDFIFGNSAAIFQDCTILVRPRQDKAEKGEDNALTAHARNDPAQSTGFVFQNCLINGTEEYMKIYYSNPKVHKNFLGRPWKEFSRTVFIGCTLEALITREGWMPWKGEFGLTTLYYGEYNNSGKGSDTTRRVKWSSRIPPEHVNVYFTTNFIQSDQWKLTS